MTDPVTIGAAVGWGISAVGWVVSPIITKLLNKGFSYLGIDGAEKLKELETKVLQLELLMEAVEEISPPNRLKMKILLQDLRPAFYQAEDILDDVEYYRLEKQVLCQPDDRFDSQRMPSTSRNWVKTLNSALPKTSCLKRKVLSCL